VRTVSRLVSQQLPFQNVADVLRGLYKGELPIARQQGNAEAAAALRQVGHTDGIVAN
jgi:hypothetical protein